MFNAAKGLAAAATATAKNAISESRGKLPVPQEEIDSFMIDMRKKYGVDTLVMVVKDDNVPGKLYLSGGTGPKLESAITKVLLADKNNEKVVKQSDEYDKTYDVTWRNTSITTGHSTFSMNKSYFPRGRLIVNILDVIARHGFTLAAAPCFGGVEARDDKGNPTSVVSWPAFVFYKDVGENVYAPSHMFLAVKDSNIPGKLCVAGPVETVRDAMTETLQTMNSKVSCQKDKYDDDFDEVWRETSLTSGRQALSFEKSYFPKGQRWTAVLKCLCARDWRPLAGPCFGGQRDLWPCLVLRRQYGATSGSPDLLFASLKDNNFPGKLCLSGPGAPKVGAALVKALSGIQGNEKVAVAKDKYDGDQGVVIHNTALTTGATPFSLKAAYFPRCDAMAAFLTCLHGEGYAVACCPGFGGLGDSWATFVFERRRAAGPPVLLAVKDDNIPGKLNLGGGGLHEDGELRDALLEVLRGLCGQKVELTKDDYDQTYELCYKNTQVSTGWAALSFTKPYFPHGYVLDAVLNVMKSKGWLAVGGPTFGNHGDTWPCILFEKARDEADDPKCGEAVDVGNDQEQAEVTKKDAGEKEQEKQQLEKKKAVAKPKARTKPKAKKRPATKTAKAKEDAEAKSNVGMQETVDGEETQRKVEESPEAAEEHICVAVVTRTSEDEEAKARNKAEEKANEEQTNILKEETQAAEEANIEEEAKAEADAESPPEAEAAGEPVQKDLEESTAEELHNAKREAAEEAQAGAAERAKRAQGRTTFFSCCQPVGISRDDSEGDAPTRLVTS